jgi:lysozyme family protein
LINDLFGVCFRVVLLEEGGFSNDPKDPGGATKYGITLQALSKSRGVKCTVSDVEKMNVFEAQKIMRKDFWDANHCENFSHGIALCLFDVTINSGPSRAAKILQKVVGVDVDGVIGMKTIAAAKALNAKDVILRMCCARVDFLRKLSNFPHAGNGWLKRVDRIKNKSLMMEINND